MLSRKYTLKGNRDFEKVEKEGVLYQSESFGLAVLDRSDKQNPVFGFVVSTKVSPDAVNRNRIKRALSEAVRQSLTEIKNGQTVVFLAKQAATRKATDALMREVKDSLLSAGLTKIK